VARPRGSTRWWLCDMSSAGLTPYVAYSFELNRSPSRFAQLMRRQVT
jgi:hypothetical protein